MLVVLDSGPLGMLCNPNPTVTTQAAHEWSRARLIAGDLIAIPEIADYEVRRELLRAGKERSVALLNQLYAVHEFLRITTAAMQEAASLWADARNTGLPTSHHAALDGDVILAAQARGAQATNPSEPVVVATTNPAHLARYTDARLWSDI